MFSTFWIKLLDDMSPKCKHLERGKTCRYGCTPLKTQCHRFQRQQCWHEEQWCWNCAHTKFQEQTPPTAGNESHGGTPAEPSPTMDDVFREVHGAIMAEIESIPAHDLSRRRALRLLLLRRWHPDKWSGAGVTLTALANKVTQWVTVNI
jgi:hypothetical protein